MEFKSWVEAQGMWNWLKKAGSAMSNWSPATPATPETISTYPGRYEVEPQKAGRALGAVKPQTYGQMTRQGQAAQPQPQTAQPQQPERVKFKAEDLLKVKAAVSDYVGLLKSFYSQVNQALGNPEKVQFAKQVFNQKVRPQYETLKSWVKWIDEMISWLPKRESVEEENDLITEAIKINYKNFEQMAGSIRALTQAMSGWLDALGQQTEPQFMNWAKRAFVQTVAAKQHHIDKQFMWITDKIKQLMDVRGREYKGLPQASAARQAPPGYPAGSQSAFS